MTNTKQSPRLVTPQEAQAMLDDGGPHTITAAREVAHTVATEPERIAEAERRGAVKAADAWSEGWSVGVAAGLGNRRPTPNPYREAL